MPHIFIDHGIPGRPGRVGGALLCPGDGGELLGSWQVDLRPRGMPNREIHPTIHLMVKFYPDWPSDGPPVRVDLFVRPTRNPRIPEGRLVWEGVAAFAEDFSVGAESLPELVVVAQRCASQALSNATVEIHTFLVPDKTPPEPTVELQVEPWHRDQQYGSCPRRRDEGVGQTPRHAGADIREQKSETPAPHDPFLVSSTDGGDPLEVCVVVDHGEPACGRRSGDDQVWDG